MQVSDAGLALIRKFEGFVAHTYNDPVGLPTIGYGHKLLPGESFPNGITETQGEQILASDAAKAGQAIEKVVTVPLTQNQFDALVDFTFNLGPGKLGASTLLRDLNAGQYDDARQQLLLWVHAGGKILPGLQARRQAEFDLWGAPAPEPQAV
jgi:lysozyme